jgi:hypothetical protein
MTAHSDALALTNEGWPSIGDPSIMVEIVLSANQAVEMVERAG